MHTTKPRKLHMYVARLLGVPLHMNRFIHATTPPQQTCHRCGCPSIRRVGPAECNRAQPRMRPQLVLQTHPGFVFAHVAASSRGRRRQPCHSSNGPKCRPKRLRGSESPVTTQNAAHPGCMTRHRPCGKVSLPVTGSPSGSPRRRVRLRVCGVAPGQTCLLRGGASCARPHRPGCDRQSMRQLPSCFHPALQEPLENRPPRQQASPFCARPQRSRWSLPPVAAPVPARLRSPFRASLSPLAGCPQCRAGTVFRTNVGVFQKTMTRGR
mmetsp:Transcript_8740/g.19421  ORF Transcript_8740/g.19421 Transcript_8740/m.19421 type:complete len:267 (+) Transcript_8740:252-1052(+)